MSELLDPVIRKALDKHDSNMRWFRNNYHILKKDRKGQLVLVIDEGKTEFYTDISKLRDRLNKDDIDTRSVVIEYISENDIPLMI
jgi:hypothetical protein